MFFLININWVQKYLLHLWKIIPMQGKKYVINLLPDRVTLFKSSWTAASPSFIPTSSCWIVWPEVCWFFIKKLFWVTNWPGLKEKAFSIFFFRQINIVFQDLLSLDQNYFWNSFPFLYSVMVSWTYSPMLPRFLP